MAVAKSLVEVLEREVRLLQSFVAVIYQEQTLLRDRTADGLAAVAQHKSHLARELGELGQTREVLLAELSFPAGRAGMDAWIRTSAGSAGRVLWERLLKLAGEAKAQNEANGAMIDIQLQHQHEALAVLRAAADQAATYGPDGQQRGGGIGRNLGSA